MRWIQKLTGLLILFLSANVLFCQELVTKDQEDQIVSTLEGFLENSGKAINYAVAIDFTSWDLEGKNLGEPTVLRGEVVIYLSEVDKFRRVTYWREVVNEGVVVEQPWRTELTRKGVISTPTIRGSEPAISYSFLASFDPLEIAAGTYTAFGESACKTGYFMSKVDIKNVLSCKSDANGNLSFVSQLWPDCQMSTTCSRKQGGMPVRTSTRLSMDMKSGRLKATKRIPEYNFLLCETLAKWENIGELWVPTWVQMDKIYGVGKSETKRRYEFELRWVVGDGLDKLDKKRFESNDLKIEPLMFEEVRKAALPRP